MRRPSRAVVSNSKRFRIKALAETVKIELQRFQDGQMELRASHSRAAGSALSSK
jgi:hypothetical protein